MLVFTSVADKTSSGGSAEAPFQVQLYGHRAAARALLSAARSGRYAQAYLLSGSPGVGKRTLARLFAQALLCSADEPVDRPCGTCRACRLVRKGGFPDLHLLEPPIKIEDVRSLQRELHLSPTESRLRVAVLPNIETASLGAANSLLKTLEEPPQSAVLIVTTADADQVLPTVRSRCRLIPLRTLSAAETAAALSEGWSAPGEQARLLSRLSQGRLGWATLAATDEGIAGKRATWLDALSRALRADSAERLACAAALSKQRDDAPVGLTHWLSWWRDLLLLTYGLEGAVVNVDRLEELRAASELFSVSAIVDSIRAVEDALGRLAASANPELALEVLVLELPS